MLEKLGKIMDICQSEYMGTMMYLDPANLVRQRFFS